MQWNPGQGVVETHPVPDSAALHPGYLLVPIVTVVANCLVDNADSSTGRGLVVGYTSFFQGTTGEPAASPLR